MSKERDTMGPIERIVYELAEKGMLGPHHGALYPRPIRKLMRAGLIEKTEKGYAVTTPTEASTSSERPIPMGTLVVRVPVSWLETLDALGAEADADRSTALRTVLGRALAEARPTIGMGSGERRKVG